MTVHASWMIALFSFVSAMAIATTPGTAAAQSYYLHEATITAEGEALGQLVGAPVRITEWNTSTEAVVAYRDRIISMRVSVDVAHPDTRLAAGVPSHRPLRTTSAFRINMTGGTWAPVWGHDSNGTRIALPGGLPVAEGVLAPSPPMARNQEPPHETFAHEHTPANFRMGCTPVRLHARPDAGAEEWLVEGDLFSLDVGTEQDGFTPARVFRDGFIVHGWIRGSAPECRNEGLGLGGIGTGCGDGHSRGIVVTLPAGTDLYASREASRPFGRLRARTLGIEPVDGVTSELCRDGVCERRPPEPTGTAPWIMHNHRRGGGGWVISAWVRTPAEDLARPTNQRAGFGVCRGGSLDWPPPPTATSRPQGNSGN